MKRTAVIMAGGSGERFWPLSRMKKPKQLLALASEKTMLEEAIDRVSPIIDVNDIYIITSELLLEPLRRELTILPPENIIAEPHKRNTAPCLALSAAFIAAKYDNEFKPEEISIAVLTADQSISPAEGFIQTIDSALNYVENNKALCTIGIPPSRPETGYGYIEVDGYFDYNFNAPEIKPVKAFHEKPTFQKAEEFLLAGNYLWNSGMFFWRLDTFIEQMILCLPIVGNNIELMQKRYKSKTSIALPEALFSISELFADFPNISIDYGLMEKAKDVVVAKALFDWDDIGSWDSLPRIREVDKDQNVVEGKNVLVDVKDSVIINSNKNDKIIVAGLGLENMVIVVTDDAVMVCPKDRVQEVKKCVEKIRTEKGEKWL